MQNFIDKNAVYAFNDNDAEEAEIIAVGGGMVKFAIDAELPSRLSAGMVEKRVEKTLPVKEFLSLYHLQSNGGDNDTL